MPRSVSETKWAPSAAMRSAEKPPNSLYDEVSSRPPRNSSGPKRIWLGSRGRKELIVFALTVIATGPSL